MQEAPENTMHCLVPLLASLFLTGPVRAEEHIVDDQYGSPWFETTGDDWATWGSNGYGFDSSDTSYHYTSSTVGGDDRRGTATWQTELGQAGTWRIEIWFRRTGNRTTDADHVVTDGLGGQTWLVIDQTGDGASGWVSLGEYWCEAGFGGCVLTLDGTDDDGSDEANAARFTLVSADGDPPETDPCDEDPGPGSHELEFYAGSASGSDWENGSYAAGEADGYEAHSPNVDEGEVLRASSFDVCDPEGDETIDSVVLAVKARTQYDSGTYALQLLLDGGGSASTVFTGTTATWHELDITGDQDWTWAALEGLNAQVSLYDHPGGARDSDAWADSFRLQVGFTTASDPIEDSGSPAQDPAGDTADTGDLGSDGSGQGSPSDEGPNPPPGDHIRYDSSVDDAACAGCAAGGKAAGGLAWLGLALLGAALGRRSFRSPQ